MIFDIVQTVSGMSALYEAQRGGKRIGSARFADNFISSRCCNLHFRGAAYDMVYHFDQQVQSWFKPREEKTGVPFQITQDGRPVGDICVKETGGSFFRRYDYYRLNFGVGSYSLYAVGLGGEGMKYPIYKGDTQIALLEKGTVVRDHLDVYRVYAIDDEASLVAFIFGLYLDMREFANRGQVSSASYEKTVKITINKSLKSKYNPAFKASVTA